jgi:transcriptional regulator with XRE-family HTH domain
MLNSSQHTEHKNNYNNHNNNRSPVAGGHHMAAKPGMPFADSKIASYLSKQIDALQGIKSQREIASEIGYDKPNMISMFKRGEAKVPLDKVPALAKAINVDPAFLFRLALEQYWPDVASALAPVFRTVISRNEEKLILAFREMTNDTDPEITQEILTKLRQSIGQ